MLASIALPVTLVFVVLASAGIIFATLCLVFNFVFRKKRWACNRCDSLSVPTSSSSPPPQIDKTDKSQPKLSHWNWSCHSLSRDCLHCESIQEPKLSRLLVQFHSLVNSHWLLPLLWHNCCKDVQDILHLQQSTLKEEGESAHDRVNVMKWWKVLFLDNFTCKKVILTMSTFQLDALVLLRTNSSEVVKEENLSSFMSTGATE